MEGLNFQDFLSTKPWKIYGPNGKLFYVHIDVVAKRSPALRKVIDGKSSENQAKSITIEDVDEDVDDDTIMRFIEYAYTGDYSVPAPDVLQLSMDTRVVAEAFIPVKLNDEANGTETAPACETYPPPEDEPIPESVQDLGSLDGIIHEEEALAFGSSGKKGKKGKRKKMGFSDSWHSPPPEEVSGVAVVASEPEVPLLPDADHFAPSKDLALNRRRVWEDFCSEAVSVQQPMWEPQSDNDRRDDYTVVFLCHARLYKLSDRYECHDLMKLSLQKLRLTLAKYVFYQERASAVVELLRYTYKHTMDYEQGYDKLRSLVLRYATCYIKQLMKEHGFIELLEDSGKLASDVCKAIVDLID